MYVPSSRRITYPSYARVRTRWYVVATVSSHRRAICFTVSPRGAQPTDSSTRKARDTLRIRSDGSARGSRTATSDARDLHHMNNLPRTECQKHVDHDRFTRAVWSLALSAHGCILRA